MKQGLKICFLPTVRRPSQDQKHILHFWVRHPVQQPIRKSVHKLDANDNLCSAGRHIKDSTAGIGRQGHALHLFHHRV